MTHCIAAVLALVVYAQPDAKDQTWTVDPVHTSVVFKINHLGVAPFYGVFKEITGSVATGSDPSFAFSIPVNSIDTRNPIRDEHVLGESLFDARQFPDLSFKSTAVHVMGDDCHVTGDLTMHGVTKSIEVTITKTGETVHEYAGHVIGFETTFTVKRSEFGMDQMLDALGDEVTLMIGIEAQAN